MADRLDDEKLEQLRSWGAGLADDLREEVRAAGRAIVLLAEEVERLQVDLWNARARVPSSDSWFDESSPRAEPAVDTSVDTRPLVESTTDLEPSLRRRLRFRRRSELPLD